MGFVYLLTATFRMYSMEFGELLQSLSYLRCQHRYP